jgi:CheY-like chemotaxis protein
MEVTHGTGSGKAEHETPSTPSAVIRVLIVDDELATRKLLAAMLGEAGVSCKAAASAEDGLSVLEKESVDAVVSDLQRPGVSGRATQFRLSTEGLAFIKELGTDRSAFAVISLWGKFGGLHACGATTPYIVPLPNIFLTLLFSKLKLKRKDFQEIVRLPWAQEAPGSNPGAPTKTSRVFSLA